VVCESYRSRRNLRLQVTKRNDRSARCHTSTLTICRHAAEAIAWAPNNDVTKPICTNTRDGRVTLAQKQRHRHQAHIPAALFDVNGFVSRSGAAVLLLLRQQNRWIQLTASSQQSRRTFILYLCQTLRTKIIVAMASVR